MKTILISGDDTFKIQERLTKLTDIAKAKKYEILKITDIEDFKKKSTNQSIISEKRLLIADDVSSIDTEIINNDKSADVLILKLEGKKGNISVKKIENLKIEKYEIPDTVFKTIDSIYPGNYYTYSNNIEKLQKKYPVEYMFSLFVFRLRELLLFEEDKNLLNYPSWRKKKIEDHYDRFIKRNVNIKSLISELSDIDIKSKTGRQGISDLLDLFFLTKIE